MNAQNADALPETPSAQKIDYAEIQSQTPIGSNVMGGNVSLLQGVKVTLDVIVGEINVTLGELMNLKALSVLEINQRVDQPVSIVLNGNVVARGELVVVGENFGVRVTEIPGPLKP